MHTLLLLFHADFTLIRDSCLLVRTAEDVPVNGFFHNTNAPLPQLYRATARKALPELQDNYI